MSNNLIISKNSSIYVTCPANIATGGPELLHQLVYELRKLGFDAYMYYLSDDENKYPVHKEYVVYQNPYVLRITDVDSNLLIVPEVYTGVLYDFKKVQKIIWWLSVDNFYTKPPKNLFKKIKKSILNKIKSEKKYEFNLKEEIHHFAQSIYAVEHLKSKGIYKVDYLSDYLNKVFIKKQMSNSLISIKKNIVVYNPKKGIDFTTKLIKEALNIDFIPIENMTSLEVAGLLSSAKVYIDFGNHPGKDRIPREAAVSGCCVITNREGSAYYNSDVPILEEYKFANEIENIKPIILKIENIFKNYEDEIMNFADYRNKIIREQEIFVNDLKKIFLEDNRYE